MKSSLSLVLFALPVVASLAACYASDPCGAGLELRSDGLCMAIPAISTATDAGAASADAAAAATTKFGTACSSTADCGGDAPVCGAPQLPYCTQLSCQTGEAHAGVCPSGFTCMTAGSMSACVKN